MNAKEVVVEGAAALGVEGLAPVKAEGKARFARELAGAYGLIGLVLPALPPGQVEPQPRRGPKVEATGGHLEHAGEAPHQVLGGVPGEALAGQGVADEFEKGLNGPDGSTPK